MMHGQTKIKFTSDNVSCLYGWFLAVVFSCWSLSRVDAVVKGHYCCSLVMGFWGGGGAFLICLAVFSHPAECYRMIACRYTLEVFLRTARWVQFSCALSAMSTAYTGCRCKDPRLLDLSAIWWWWPIPRLWSLDQLDWLALEPMWTRWKVKNFGFLYKTPCSLFDTMFKNLYWLLQSSGVIRTWKNTFLGAVVLWQPMAYGNKEQCR